MLFPWWVPHYFRRKLMGLSPQHPADKQIFSWEEEEIGRKWAGGGTCPFCGGPVLSWNLDAHLFFCFFPIAHKLKTKFSCALCSARLVPKPNRSSSSSS